MKTSTQISKEDLDAFIEGSREAFEVVYNCYKQRVYFYALKLTKAEELAEEVTQDVFIRVWSNREKIDTQYSFSSFLFRVTHNHTLNVLKRLNYEQQAKERLAPKYRQGANVTEDTVVHDEYMSILSTAINLLPPKRKSIFDLSRTKGVSHDEIALKMGISKNTVKSQLVKATKFIKTYFIQEAGVAI
ncbi:MAG: RNA polymerase sigma-70 factor [Cyclobacteriaceae bacterium]